jgi:hypothetical protein
MGELIDSNRRVARRLFQQAGVADGAQRRQEVAFGPLQHGDQQRERDDPAGNGGRAQQFARKLG